MIFSDKNVYFNLMLKKKTNQNAHLYLLVCSNNKRNCTFCNRKIKRIAKQTKTDALP